MSGFEGRTANFFHKNIHVISTNGDALMWVIFLSKLGGKIVHFLKFNITGIEIIDDVFVWVL